MSDAKAVRSARSPSSSQHSHVASSVSAISRMVIAFFPPAVLCTKCTRTSHMLIILYIIPSVYGFHEELFLSILQQFGAVIVKRTCGNGCFDEVQEAVNGLIYDLSRIPDSPIDYPCQKSAVRRKSISVFYTIYTHSAFTAFFFLCYSLIERTVGQSTKTINQINARTI